MTPEAMELTRQFAEVTKESTLVEIADAIVEAAEVNEDGEFTPESLARLEALQLTLDQKGEAYAVVHAQLEAEAKSNKELADYYTQRAKARSNVAARLKQRLQGEMVRLGVTKLAGPRGSACLQESPPSVAIPDESAVPSDYTVVERKVRRRDVLEALKAGQTFEWASLVRGKHLRFR